MALRTSKIDGGSRWRWFAEPDPAGTYLALATIIELRSIWHLPRFEWYSQLVHRQLGRTPGLLGFSFRGQFPLRYWTLSAWRDGRALRDFVKVGTHDTVMGVLPSSTRRFEHVNWKVTGEALPLSWAEGLRRLDERGGAP